MATLPPLLAIRPCWGHCGAIESSKLIVTANYASRSKLTCILENVGGMRTGSGYTRWKNGWKLFATSQISVDQTEEEVGVSTETGELEEVSKYLYRTEMGGMVNVVVGRKNMRYILYIEVSSMELHNIKKELVLIWGVSRASIDFQSLTPDSKQKIYETPFSQKPLGKFALDIELEAKETPFNFTFLLKDLSDAEFRSHRKTNFCVPVGFTSGKPLPLGLSFQKDGFMNFAFFSRIAESVVLCLYDDSTTNKPCLEIDLDPYVNRTGQIWHASIEKAWNYVSYGYRCKMADSQDAGDTTDTRQVLLDPYAKVIGNTTSISDLNGSGLNYLGQLCKEPVFDWRGDTHPNLPMEKLLVYWLNVRHFTLDKSSKLSSDVAGTFAGLTEKLHHFVDLGVNAVLLEPIFPFSEQEGPYFPNHFFSPSHIYGPPSSSNSISAINSMKEMVKKFHANGVEVLLEVVFTHTSESGALQGIDNSSYYYVNKESKTISALNCNYPIVQQMIIDSLRHWVTEFHVDGFCFVNTSSLLRGSNGESLSRPPLVETIAFDPLLSRTKIIADCWDPHGMAPRGVRFPHWKRWAEVNSNFSIDVRTFLRGEGLLSNLATRLCGSGDTFSDGRGPAFSFNFISRNYGLSLVDLVSFSNDTLASELSWNCGEEGPTTKTIVLERRLKQIRNFLFILYVSLGVPILNMGDECGQSTGGSVGYTERKPFDWNALQTGYGIQMIKFISFLSALRVRRSDLLQRRNFLKVENIIWNGSDQSPPKWEDPTSKFLSMTLSADPVESQSNSEPSPVKGDLFLAFNAADHSESVILPPPSEGMAWQRLVDTALPFPGFFLADGEPVVEQMVGLFAYEMKSYSCTLFEARSLDD